MGRTPSFDQEQAVRAARKVFWERGYEAASIPELEAATGLSRSSIYNAFGSKRGLFDAAVCSYLNEVVRPLLSPLQVNQPSSEAIITYLDALRAAFASAADDSRTMAGDGCLLLNTAGAPLAHDENIAHTVAGYRQELRSALGRGVRARRHELTSEYQEELSESLTAMVIEAFILVRVAPSQAVHVLDVARRLATGSAGSEAAAIN